MYGWDQDISCCVSMHTMCIILYFMCYFRFFRYCSAGFRYARNTDIYIMLKNEIYSPQLTVSKCVLCEYVGFFVTLLPVLAFIRLQICLPPKHTNSRVQIYKFFRIFFFFNFILVEYLVSTFDSITMAYINKLVIALRRTLD